jgi:hypothetical protein
LALSVGIREEQGRLDLRQQAELCVVVLFAMGASVIPARAIDCFWTGATTNEWTTGTNWGFVRARHGDSPTMAAPTSDKTSNHSILKAAKIRARRGIAVRLLVVWSALCLFGARAYSQTGIGETLSGPDSHETRQGADAHLLGDWGGVRTRLLQRGVRFDFQYISDTVWGFESQQKPQFATWNRFRATVDVDFGALAGQEGLYFHATGLWQAGGNLGEKLGLLTGPSGMASNNTARLDSWWIEKRWLDERIVARVGQFAGQDFYGVQHYGASFIFEPMGYALGNLFRLIETEILSQVRGIDSEADPGHDHGPCTLASSGSCHRMKAAAFH